MAAPKLPSKIDWRDHGGNFVTPVRDQQFYGSCVAFGTLAVLESMIMIKARGVQAAHRSLRSAAVLLLRT